MPVDSLIRRVARFGTPVLIVLAIAVGCAAATTLVTSRLYWGYWIALPSADWAVRPFVSMERFTSFFCCTDPVSGRHALADAAQGPSEATGDAPVQNLPRALLAHALVPISDDSVPASLLVTLRDNLDAAGVLEAAEPEYKYAKSLRGHVAVGRDAEGSEVIAAALFSGEVSNDHHAYYEAVFRREPSGRLTLLGVRRYWWDFAGLEGVAQWLAGILAGVIVLSAMGVRALWKLRVRSTG